MRISKGYQGEDPCSERRSFILFLAAHFGIEGALPSYRSLNASFYRRGELEQCLMQRAELSSNQREAVGISSLTAATLALYLILCRTMIFFLFVWHTSYALVFANPPRIDIFSDILWFFTTHLPSSSTVPQLIEIPENCKYFLNYALPWLIKTIANHSTVIF